MLSAFSRYQKKVSNVVLAGRHLLSPWSHSAGVSWKRPASSKKASNTHVPILYIAPGESVDITVHLLDELISRHSGELTAMVGKKNTLERKVLKGYFAVLLRVWLSTLLG